MPYLRDDRYDAELQAEMASFAAAVRDADPARPVPTCPAWTLAQLTAHVGFGHRWAAVTVERRATGPVPNDQADDLQVPQDAEERSRWLLAGAPAGRRGPRGRSGDRRMELGRGPDGGVLAAPDHPRHPRPPPRGRAGGGVLSRRTVRDGSRLEVSGSRPLLAHWLEHSRLEPA
jgi:Mycothiol maleylpyruvate isomerase N-terminal domain